MMSFAEPIWFLALLALPLLFVLRKRGYLGFSDRRLLDSSKRSRSLRWLARAPLFFAATAMVLMVVALARPQVPGDPLPRTIAGRDIVLAVDISFSMSFPFKGELKAHETPDELKFQTPFNERRRNDKGLHFDQPKDGKLQRIHAAQSALLSFIENRWKGDTGDRIGLIVFDVRPRYAWPITDDLRMLYRKAQFIQNNLGTGTNFGKNPPGPIDLAAEHFKESGQAKSRVLILVTDGEDDIDPQTKQRLARILKDNNIRLYLVGVGETLVQKEVGIIQLAKQVNGQIFRVEDADSIAKCFETIDNLEKSEVTVSQLETRNDVFFYFAWAALVAFVMFLLSELFVLTR
jgi:von Willebrand factor type A domain.